MSSAIFSVALGIAGVSIPLLALQVDIDAVHIGMLIALPAIAQIVMRSFMGGLMRRLPDKVFVLAGAFLLALSCGTVAVSTSIAAFIVALLLQGVARALFFTSSWTHAVRVSDSPVRALTSVNFFAGVGGFVGPGLAGLLFAFSIQFPLYLAVVIGVAGMVPAALLVRLPPFKPVAHKGTERILRRPGVDVGCWMTSISGAWKGLLDSYVPIILTLAGQSPSMVGILVAIGYAALLVGTGITRFVRGAGIRGALILGVAAVGLGFAALGPLSKFALAAAAALALSALGAGVMQVLGPAVATEMVQEEERGDAITVTGLFRSGALFVAPMGMAGLVLIVPVGVAFVIGGVLITLPGILWRPPRGN